MKHKTLMIIGLVVIVVVVSVILIISMNSKRLVCKYDKGNITLTYNDKKLTGYYVSGELAFDMESQNLIILLQG
jgi:hypothetical protein